MEEIRNREGSRPRWNDRLFPDSTQKYRYVAGIVNRVAFVDTKRRLSKAARITYLMTCFSFVALLPKMFLSSRNPSCKDPTSERLDLYLLSV